MKRLIFSLSFVALAAAPIVAQSTPPPSKPEAVSSFPEQAPPPSRPSPQPTPPPSQGAPGQNRNVPPPQNQAPPAAPMSQQGQQGARNDGGGTWQNVKIDLLINDSGSPRPEKLMTLLVTDGWSGQIRSSGGQGLINVDAQPKIRPDGRIFVRLTMEYQPEFQTGQEIQAYPGGKLAFLNESLSLVVVDGKRTLASQSADPRTDRKVTVEVVATIMK